MQNTTPPMVCADCINLDWNYIKENRKFNLGFCRRFSSVMPKSETACSKFVHTDLPSWEEIEAAAQRK